MPWPTSQFLAELASKQSVINAKYIMAATFAFASRRSLANKLFIFFLIPVKNQKFYLTVRQGL